MKIVLAIDRGWVVGMGMVTMVWREDSYRQTTLPIIYYSALEAPSLMIVGNYLMPSSPNTHETQNQPS